MIKKVDEYVNVITDNMNNNVVNVIVNDLFGDQAIVDTGKFLSFVDNNFCKKHNLHVIPLQPGESRTYIAVGKTRITAIGSTNIVLIFAGKKFSHNFQITKNLSTNILIGINFIRKYDCVAYLSHGIFSLGNARITVPIVVKRDTLGLAQLREQVKLQPITQQIVRLSCLKINGQYFYWSPQYMRIRKVSTCPILFCQIKVGTIVSFGTQLTNL